MKIYMGIEKNPDPSAQTRFWYGSKKAAADCHGLANIHRVDVDTSKAGLLEILNRLAWR